MGFLDEIQPIWDKLPNRLQSLIKKVEAENKHHWCNDPRQYITLNAEQVSLRACFQAELDQTPEGKKLNLENVWSVVGYSDKVFYKHCEHTSGYWFIRYLFLRGSEASNTLALAGLAQEAYLQILSEGVYEDDQDVSDDPAKTKKKRRVDPQKISVIKELGKTFVLPRFKTPSAQVDVVEDTKKEDEAEKIKKIEGITKTKINQPGRVVSDEELDNAVESE